VRLLIALVWLATTACNGAYQRIGDLDDQVTVPCGYVYDCDAPGVAAAAISCLRDSLANGTVAKAVFTENDVIGDVEVYTHVYALDGAFVSIADRYGSFSESVCHDLAIDDSRSACMGAYATECELVREWSD
jgi:hypothetical protein